MYIKWMHIENYRNLTDVTCDFTMILIISSGENAVGKSNFESLRNCHGVSRV